MDTNAHQLPSNVPFTNDGGNSSGFLFVSCGGKDLHCNDGLCISCFDPVVKVLHKFNYLWAGISVAW